MLMTAYTSLSDHQTNSRLCEKRYNLTSFESAFYTYLAPISVPSPSSSMSKSGCKAQQSTTALYLSWSYGYPNKILSLMDWWRSHGDWAAYEMECIRPFSSTLEVFFDMMIRPPGRSVISPRSAIYK